MSAPPPIDALEALAARVLPSLRPWFEPVVGPASRELRHRLILLLNHIIGQEPEAMGRLARQRGRVVEISWRDLTLRLALTPAGLLEEAAEGARADLTLAVAQSSPWELAQMALRGDKPEVRIAGDVQLAAEINWCVDHVRWDIEEDLARLMGDAPAHALVAGLRQAAAGLRAFATRWPTAGRSGAGADMPGAAR
jgi:ubiquinone biosynthesis protein UbiJ